MGVGGRTSCPMRPMTSTPQQTAAHEGGVEGDGHCHCRRWWLIDLSCRGRCQRVRLKGLLSHAQTHNKQIHINQLVLLFILFLFSLHLFFLCGPISTSCFKSKSFPDFREVTLKPLSKSNAAWCMATTDFFLHVLNLLVCNISWLLVTLIVAVFSNNLQQSFIGQHVTPGLPAEFTD